MRSNLNTKVCRRKRKASAVFFMLLSSVCLSKVQHMVDVLYPGKSSSSNLL